MTNGLPNLRDFLFRGLTLEAEAETFRQAGIRVGADTAPTERALFEETLAPFAVGLRNDAIQMGRLYALIYCFENSIRELIRERLLEKYKADWWDQGVPQKVRMYAESRKQSAEKDGWLQGHKTDQLGFVDFGHLASIITEKWDLFSDLVPTQQWLKQRLDELEKCRHFIAHNRMLLPSEFGRIEMYVDDWNHTVAL